MQLHTKLALALAAPLALLASCSAPTAGGNVNYGRYGLSGDVNMSAGGVSGSNSVNDLGLGDKEETAGVAAFVKFGGPMIYFSGYKPEFKGNGTLSADLTSDGITIPAGTPVSSRLELGMYQGLFLWDLLPSNSYELGIGLGVEGIDYDSSFSGSGQTVSSSESLPVPVLAAMAKASLGPFNVQGKLAGMAIKVDGDDLELIDLDLHAEWKFLGIGRLVGGYRYMTLDLDYEDDGESVIADLKLDGPYLGLGVSF